MSNGADALRGYIYQADYVAYRFLASVAAKLLEGYYDQSGVIDVFRIEGRADKHGEVWDVILTKEDGSIEFLECKDTAITRSDRAVFYKRVRREFSSHMSFSEVSVGWVTDPSKQTSNMLDSLRGLACLASKNRYGLPANAPSRVISSQTAFKEALWHLCNKRGNNGSDNPLSLGQASQLLRSVVVREHRHDDLKRSVERLSTVLFEHGIGEAIRELTIGALVSEVSNKGTVSYSLDTFLKSIGATQFALVSGDVFKEILQWYRSLPPVPMTIEWRRLSPAQQKSWPLEERLKGIDKHVRCMVAGTQGVGKTVTTLQACQNEKAKRNPYHVFWIQAEEVTDSQKVKALPDLCLILAGIAPVWLAIDGLDEIEDYDGWRECLSLLVRVPDLTLVISARKEVLAVDQRLGRIVEPFTELELQELEEHQVREAFADVGLTPPQNGCSPS